MDAMALNTFRSALEEQGKAARTVNGYIGDLQLFARWFQQSNGEELAPDHLTPTDVKQYRAYLQTTQRARPATINRRLATLRLFGAVLVSKGMAEYNSAEGIRGLEEQPLSPKWLDKKQQAALIREAERRYQAANTGPARYKAIRNLAIVTLLLNTGLRIGELTALEIGDILISERKGELGVRNGKGGKARRIPLNYNARKALQYWFKVRLGNGSNRVFTGYDGNGLNRRGIQHMLAELGMAAKVEGVSPHTLRHTFAKNLVNMGVGLEQVAPMLGHRNLNTTRIYTTPGIQDLEKAVELLDD